MKTKLLLFAALACSIAIMANESQPVFSAGEDACVPGHTIAGGDACAPGRHGEYSYNGAAWRLHILEKDERKDCNDRLF